MIITRIIGGLGNQLFQYAAGKALAVNKNTDLLLDVSAFDEYKLRNFDLTAFHTEIQFAKQEELVSLRKRNFAEKIRDNIFPMALRKVYKPKHFHFHPRFFNASPNIYLQGYWQSEKYFETISSHIRKEFTIKEEYIKNVTQLADEIRKSSSVSVHIRRGDLNNPTTNEVHVILEIGYYKEALQIIRQIVPDAILYFFSDDLNWVKENLHIDGAVYVSGTKSETHIEDFYLMSQCKHNIIANSSFSWWAAWLNNNPDKIVIAPKNWFNKGPKDTQDLIPAGWLRI
ncbi:MAG: alpha-1,2-fucosyltransferase [Chitinophagaceae bacterium]